MRAQQPGAAAHRCGEARITIAEFGEFALIAAIGERLPGGPGQIIGIGDDAAVLRAADGRVVAATDMLIEGRHFRREWSSPRDIGRKAAARNLADVAAMGARPTALLVGFAGPGELDVAWVLALADGIGQECAATGASVAGGDTSSADVVMLAITALGDLAGRAPVTRGGARPGDVVALAGRVGAAAAGLALLSAGLGAADAGPAVRDPGLGYLIRAHQRPEPPYDAGPEAAALGATSMIDISDGLVADLGHVAAASGVRVELRSSLIAAEPVARPGPLARAADLLGRADWLPWVLTGGDDHALAATFPPDVALPGRWTEIGQVTPGQGVGIDGRNWDKPGGWEHFRVRLRIVFEPILNVTRPACHLLDITTLMPRHRLEGRPRHRTKRQGFRPVRGVRLLATRNRPARGDEEAAGPATTSRSGRLAGPGSRPEYGRIVRGAMLTPWFAVSVGIVVATSLTLATPHAALTFPAPKSGRCAQAGCTYASPPAKGRQPAIRNEVPLPPQPDASVRLSGIKVEYALQQGRDGQFMAVILIVSRHALKDWTLRFVLPGAHIGAIMWAKWQPDGQYGVLVSGSPLPWPRSGANEARIVITGSGTPGPPTGCVFDSGRCRFHALSMRSDRHDDKHHHWSSRP